MWASAVTLATRRSAFSFAYMRWRRWPGCTMSKTPWHMITVFARGRVPMTWASSSRVLILWRNMGRLLRRRRQVGEPGFRRGRDRLGCPQRCPAPVVEVPQHRRHPFLEGHDGLPAETARDLADVGPGE